ncbi:MAG: hypothetical protein HFJ95_00625 [Muribaculaceae bacterium]|jgi:hypothetical protein|nr:hypothetical protein [Muribaculaceae bacterium]
MKAIRRFTAIATLTLAGVIASPAQTFFSVNAGTDGFNVNLTNALPFFSPAVVVAPPPPPRHVAIPLRPGLVYEYPTVSPKHYKKAVKRYRKAVRNSRAAGVVALPGGITVAIPVGGGHYYDYDDDDYEDWLKDQYKHHKKMSKKYKKAYKHHKHHKHHHDDDDD